LAHVRKFVKRMNLGEDSFAVLNGGGAPHGDLANAIDFAGDGFAALKSSSGALAPSGFLRAAKGLLDVVIDIVLPPARADEANPWEGNRAGIWVEQEFQLVAP